MNNNESEGVVLFCILCETEWEGDADQQIWAYFAHDCKGLREMNAEQIEEAKRRHPTSFPDESDAAAMFAALVFIASLVIGEVLIDKFARQVWSAPLLICLIFVAAVIALGQQFQKLKG
jgi:hypothetical protein